MTMNTLLRLTPLLTALFILFISFTTQTRGYTLPSAHVRARAEHPEFYVDGSKLPLISDQVGDIGPSWAGYIPVDAKDPSRAMYFWLFPRNASAYTSAAEDDLIIWFPAGPGVSSVKDALQQIGPVLMPINSNGTTQVVRNPHSWVQTAHLLFIDAPLGTGFSVGTPNITDDTGLAHELIGFLDGLFVKFPEYASKRIYLAGHGVGSLAMTYVADYIMEQRPKWKYKGLIYIAPWVSDLVWTEDVPAVKFFNEHRQLMAVREDEREEFQRQAEKLKVDQESVEALLTFPPSPIVPPPDVITKEGQSIWVAVRDSVRDLNPCFSQYDILQKCPFPYDPWGVRGFEYAPTSRVNVINLNPDFLHAIHAKPLPDNDFRTWKYNDDHYYTASDDPDHADATPLLANTPFAGQVWTKTIAGSSVNGSVLIVAGGLDYDQIAFGTLLGIQNITWGGQRGFQTKPQERLLIDGQDVGVKHTERGVTWTLLDRAVHELVVSQPAEVLKLVQDMLNAGAASNAKPSR